MNPPNASAAPTPIRSARRPRGLFASVRASRDATLAAFASALLLAFVAYAAAFVPRLPGSAQAGGGRIEAAPARTVFARGAAAPAPAVPAAGAPAVARPCASPRS